MSLSCECDFDWDGEPGTWYYIVPNDFTKLYTKNRRRCKSCGVMINHNEDCVEFERYRAPYTEIEEQISGEEIQISSMWMCEKCGEICLNLSELGYCVSPEDDMRKSLKEYHELTGFKHGDTCD